MSSYFLIHHIYFLFLSVLVFLSYSVYQVMDEASYIYISLFEEQKSNLIMCSLGLDSHILGEGITLVQVRRLHAHSWSVKLWP